MKDLYTTDFYSWTLQQAEALRSGDFSRVDLENLIEEVESLANEQRNELSLCLITLFNHLLTWRYQPNELRPSLSLTIKKQRRSIERQLRRNAGLKTLLSVEIADAYQYAREEAADETSLPLITFPALPLWTYDEFMSRDFLPD